jgi:hypothetical protein
MKIVPVNDPVADGENVTETVHDAPAAMLVPQLFVCEKFGNATISPNVSITALEFVILNVIGALTVPTVCVGKVSDDGESRT